MDLPPFSQQILPLLKAPGKGDDTDVEFIAGELGCRQTGETYPMPGGIPSLCAPSLAEDAEVTKQIQSFHDKTPFPDYEGVEEFGELVSKGHANPFSRDLLAAIGYNKTVLECGCGTGQLSHFLQLNNNHVLGIDPSLAALRLAIEHRRRNQLFRANFCQMSVADMAIKDNVFDVVIANRALLDGFDAQRVFAEIVRKCKPGGIIVARLYNWPARFPVWVRSKLINIFGPRIDYAVRTRFKEPRKAAASIGDQYRNPYESWHSIGEVMLWFGENNVDFLNCRPPILDTAGEEVGDLFRKTNPGTAWNRGITQVEWLGTLARDGAQFHMIGRKAA